MRNTRWIPKATETHSEYVILIDFPLQQWLHERASVLCCTYTARLVLSSLPFICVHSSLKGPFFYFPALAMEAVDRAIYPLTNAAPHRVITVKPQLATRAVG